MRRLVCDTGPLLHLREADLLPLLRLAGDVLIPPMVEVELMASAPDWSLPEWVVLTPLDPSFAEEALRWQRAGLIDPGEAEALALARQVGAEWLLTDDAAARWVASSQGQEVHGSLGVVLWAAVTGHLAQPQAEDALEALAHTSLWISAQVLEEAKAALRQIFA